MITLWAKFGNLLFEYNWFFLEEDAFYIGLVANGIIPKWSLMLLTPAGVFLIVVAVYAIYHGVKAWLEKRANSAVETKNEVLAEVAVDEQ